MLNRIRNERFNGYLAEGYLQKLNLIKIDKNISTGELMEFFIDGYLESTKNLDLKYNRLVERKKQLILENENIDKELQELSEEKNKVKIIQTLKDNQKTKLYDNWKTYLTRVVKEGRDKIGDNCYIPINEEYLLKKCVEFATRNELDFKECLKILQDIQNS